MNGMAIVTNKASVAIKGLQSGHTQQYVLFYLLGALLLALFTAWCVL